MKLQDSACYFTTSLRFELFYALQTLSDTNSRVHSEWKKRTFYRLSKEFGVKNKAIGGSPVFWANFSDVFQNTPIDLSFDQIRHEMNKIAVDEFQRRILTGLIHYDELSRHIVAGKLTLQRGLEKAPKGKREWLAFAGLFPYDRNNPEIKTLEFMLDDPSKFRNTISELISIFWDDAFSDTWKFLQPQYQRSIGEKERLFQSCSFSEFAKHALLRIEVDESKKIIRALRGGAEDQMSKIKAYYFIPSAFNDKRLWTACPDEKLSIVYFPYFDPTITLDLIFPENQLELIEPELDPALIFRVLGDATRYAIVSIIAKTPKSSVELTKLLAVSKSTISQHVNLLRQAGLIDEQRAAGSIKISLRRKVLEQLSTIVIAKLYNASPPGNLSKTRRKT
ncbi:MAG: winged helix-turn-helix transcriptional regulator [Candidatus Riflebacteria bacterium]|nr:winged helix-turn-helix transcriptional regulator [Candidatus Riflebacteria bacterium]